MLSSIPRLLTYIPLVASIAFAFHPAQRGYIPSPNAAIINCLNSNHVPYASNTSPNWDYLATDFNLRVVFEPTIITLPKTPEDVSSSVKCATKNGLKVQAKSGGHSYGSYSLGGQNGSLIVDLEAFDTLVVDQKTFIATVGGGVRLGNLALGLDAQGKRALPHGSAPGVGVGGHFTYGGRGYASRLWGLSLDTIVGMDVVLANGSYVHASATQNTEIFWAMRGAAGSFGIVLYFYLQTEKQPAQVVNFWAEIPAILEDASTAAKSFLTLQETVLDPEFAIPEIAFSVTIMQGTQFNISGWCLDCDLDHFNSVIFPRLLRGLPTPASKDTFIVDWLGTVTLIANGSSLAIPKYGYEEHDTFYAQSVQTTNKIPLAENELESYFDYIINQGKTVPSPWFSFIDLYGGPNSKLNSFPSNSSAYSQRDVLWMVMNYGMTANRMPPFLDTAKDFISGLSDALMKFNPQNFGVYLAVVDPDASPTEWALRGYGVETYNKLLHLKQKYDPGFVFWNPQAIGVAPALPQEK